MSRRPRPRRGTPPRPGAAASRPPAPGAARPAPCPGPGPPVARRTPDGDRDQRDRQRGDQLEHGRGGEGDAQGLQGGPAVALGDLADRAVCASARRKATSVGRPRITSRKWPDSDDSARHCACARSRVARPTSAPNTGTSGSVASTMTALEQVLGGDRHAGEQRQHRGEHQRRQVAGEVGLGGADAAGHQHRQLALPRRAPSAPPSRAAPHQPAPQVPGDRAEARAAHASPAYARQRPGAGRRRPPPARERWTRWPPSTTRHDQPGDAPGLAR